MKMCYSLAGICCDSTLTRSCAGMGMPYKTSRQSFCMFADHFSDTSESRGLIGSGPVIYNNENVGYNC